MVELAEFGVSLCCGGWLVVSCLFGWLSLCLSSTDRGLIGLSGGRMDPCVCPPTLPCRSNLLQTNSLTSAPDCYRRLLLLLLLFGNNNRPWALRHERQSLAKEMAADPSHPLAYDVLREAIIRETGGYVHDDLGWLVPAPCGAARGLGMVRNFYQECQTRCFPGTWPEKQIVARDKAAGNGTEPAWPDESPLYKQEEVLIRVPLKFQMTRQVALETLLMVIPNQADTTLNLFHLDDAALLVLLLAHERGVGRYSRWLPYIATLPHQPACGYARNLRPFILDMLQVLHVEHDVETEGWSTELIKASQYASKIVESLNRDYGPYLERPPGVTGYDNLEWALCHVASRATAGDEKHGSLRLVPLMDMINHDATAGGFIELTGQENYEAGDFVQATETDAGTFVVRSLRHGRRRPLAPGQELLVDYNVPNYAPLDWLISTGFVPPERWGRWHKVDRVWPPTRWNSVPDGAMPTSEQWARDGDAIMAHIQETNMKDAL
jgi:hypothetical protein